MDYNKFDNAFDLAGLQKDIEDAAAGNIERVDIPVGEYEVKIHTLELGESKAGAPMVKMWFKILNGEYAKHIIFMNQVIKEGFQIHIVNTLLRSMDTSLDIHFESFGQYAELLEAVFQSVDGSKEFALDYGKNDKGYNTYKITKVFNL